MTGADDEREDPPDGSGEDGDDAALPPGSTPDGSDLRRGPTPPRRARTLTLIVMGTSALGAAALGWSIWPEARYGMLTGPPLELGLLTSASLGPAQAGRYARALVEPHAGVAVSFRRLGEDGTSRVVLVTATPEPRFVEYRVPGAVAGPRFVPPTIVAGRLARVSDLGARHRGLRGALDRLVGGSTANGWVLLDGEDPDADNWVVCLLGLLAVFVAWNLVGIYRVARRVS